MTTQQMLSFFIRQTAKKVIVNEQIVDIIIRDQWNYANKATRQLKQVEIAEIGTFYPSTKKLLRRMTQLERKIKHFHALLAGDPENSKYLKTLNSTQETYNNLKQKYDELDKQHLEEQASNTRGTN